MEWKSNRYNFPMMHSLLILIFQIIFKALLTLEEKAVSFYLKKNYFIWRYKVTKLRLCRIWGKILCKTSYRELFTSKKNSHIIQEKEQIMIHVKNQLEPVLMEEEHKCNGEEQRVQSNRKCVSCKRTVLGKFWGKRVKSVEHEEKKTKRYRSQKQIYQWLWIFDVCKILIFKSNLFHRINKTAGNKVIEKVKTTHSSYSQYRPSQLI